MLMPRCTRCCSPFALRWHSPSRVAAAPSRTTTATSPRRLLRVASSSSASEPSDTARNNPLNIQMLSPSLHAQVFPHANTSPTSPSQTTTNAHAIAISHAHLDKWQLDISNSTQLPNIHLPLPPLQGPTIAHHFARLGERYAQPTLDLIHAWLAQPTNVPPLPTDPSTWLMLPGWTRYDPIDGSPTSVPYPDGPVVVFDVETCPKRSRYPVMATALTASGWYAWVSPWLMRAASSSSSSSPSPSDPAGAADLIPLGPHAKVVIGHNISYDRACVLEEYSIHGTDRVWLDTLSLHVATNGMSSQQRPDFDKVQRVLKKAAADRAKAAQELAPEVAAKLLASAADAERMAGRMSRPWMKHTTSNGLAACAKYYLGVDMQKTTRDAFVDAESADPIVADFANLMHYCATDVQTTANVFGKIFPQFLLKCPHPISFVGQAAMGSCFLPVNDEWPKFIAQCDDRVKSMVDEIEAYLVMLAHMTVDLVIDRSAAVKLYEDGEGDDGDDEFPLCGYLPEGLKLRHDVLESNPWLAQLNWECKPLRITKKGLPYKNQKLPNYPEWFRELWDPQTRSIAVTQRKRATPLLLQLTWLGFPLIHSEREKWGYMVSPADLGKHTPSTPEIVFKSGSADSIVFQRWIDQGYRFFKLPHPDGDAANAGNPFTKSFAQYFADGTLQSAHPQAKQALELQLLASYWISSGDRIRSQFVVWDKEAVAAAHAGAGAETAGIGGASNVDLGIVDARGAAEGRKHWGMILPQMQVMGTITRRATENTWLTASNAKKGRLGSDVKRYVVAPPGYALVGADVDSEELWISSVMGDAQFGEHGATALGWMTLQGTKAHGTDLHSVTAAILGITRDQAKQFNYARIYGAGEAFATGTLRQHSRELSMEEATRKAKTLYEKTKGLKSSTMIAGVTPSEFDYWMGGRESFMFNSIESIAHSENPRTPVLGCQIPNSLMREHCGSAYLTSRINWVVQSSGVDYLHLLIVSMQYFVDVYKIDARLLITIHDEIRYMVREEDKYRAALALQISNLWTRAMFAYKMGFSDLPQSVAFFSAIDIDHCLRKEVNDPCITPTNPTPIPPGESLDIYGLLAKGDQAMLPTVPPPSTPPSPPPSSHPSLESLNPQHRLSWLLLQTQTQVPDFMAVRNEYLPESEANLELAVSQRPKSSSSSRRNKSRDDYLLLDESARFKPRAGTSTRNRSSTAKVYRSNGGGRESLAHAGFSEL